MVAGVLAPFSLGATPTMMQMPLVPTPQSDVCADNPEWSGTSPFGTYTCADWYGFKCNGETAGRCNYADSTVSDLQTNCPETCDTCEKSINVHGDPMFRAGDRYTKLVMPEGKLQPLLSWTTSEGSKCVLHGSTVSAGDDDEEDQEAQWFTHFRVEVNGTTVLDVDRVLPDGGHSKTTKMQVKLDGKGVAAAQPGLSSPEQHNSANRVVGLKLGTMGKRFIGSSRAERLVLNAGGMPMEITSAAARKFKSGKMQVKYAHFNLHIDKLPAGATGLIAELKGMQPLSRESMTYLREEPHFHLDGAKKTELHQKHRKEKRNLYEGICPGQDPYPPAPPRAPVPPFAELESLTPLPPVCTEGDEASPAYPTGITFCEQSPDEYTCRHCCDFGDDGPRSTCASGGHCMGDGDDFWAPFEGCAAQIDVLFNSLKDGAESHTCLVAKPVPATCIRAFNILSDDQDEWGEKCLALIDPFSIDKLSEDEIAQTGYAGAQQLLDAVWTEGTKIMDQVAAVGAEYGVSIDASRDFGGTYDGTKPVVNQGMTAGNPMTAAMNPTMKSGMGPTAQTFYCTEGPSGACYGTSVAEFGSAPSMGNWKAPEYSADYASFQAFCESWSSNGGTFNGGTGACPAIGGKLTRKARIDEAMKDISPKMNKHHTWKAMVAMLHAKFNPATDLDHTKIGGHMKQMIAESKKALRKASALPAAGFDSSEDEELKFCVTTAQVQFIIEIVTGLVKHCIKLKSYGCAPKSWCDSTQCSSQGSRVMLKACMKDQGNVPWSAAAHVRLPKTKKNTTLSACEAAEFAIKQYELPEDAHAEDYLTMLRSHSTVVKEKNIISGLRSMLRARKRKGKHESGDH